MAKRLWCLFVFLLACAGAQAQVTLGASQVAVVVNDAQPDSVTVGEYYRKAHRLPAANLVHVSIPDAPRKLDAAQFRLLKQDIDSQLPAGIQAVVLVWTAPYAVECNGITAAYTLGLDHTLCARSCGPGQANPLYDARSRQPYTDKGLRLSMLLPVESVPQAKALIDRGVAARAQPAGAYYLTTGEAARNSRVQLFPPAGRLASRRLTIHRLSANALEHADDVIVYELGAASVAGLDTVRFRPGALADHLTSFGGDLLGNGQMSILRWLDAGATASYGTVSEPCNYWQKFPNPMVLLKHYVSGETALEAYWKSVAWPAQGVFVGDPLAAPYRR
jgi:uncharacterized protein (TIGR03790 family)